MRLDYADVANLLGVKMNFRTILTIYHSKQLSLFLHLKKLLYHRDWNEQIQEAEQSGRWQSKAWKQL